VKVIGQIATIKSPSGDRFTVRVDGDWASRQIDAGNTHVQVIEMSNGELAVVPLTADEARRIKEELRRAVA
jgi:hypothetical protein